MTGHPHIACPRGGTLRRLVAAICGFASLLVGASSASAQSCETNPGGVLQTFPASNSRDVPRNGLVIVQYCPIDEPVVDRTETRLLRVEGDPVEVCSCEPGAECLEVVGLSRCLVEIDSRVELDGDEVRLEADRDLTAYSAYVIEAPAPQGIRRVLFTTGDQLDDEPPRFEGLTDVRIRSCFGGRGPATCPDDGREGFVAVLSAQAADDASGRINLEYRGYQVRDLERIERGRARGDGATDVTFTIFIPADDLEAGEWELLCFAMSAQDPYGYQASPEQTICERTPEYSPFGSACRAAPGPSGGGTGLWPALLVLAVLVGRALRAS